jgi:copper(I)-binding protein
MDSLFIALAIDMNKILFLAISVLTGFVAMAGVAGAAESSSPRASVRAVPGQLAQVEGAWIRSTVAGQQGTGAFMRITARQPMQLVGVATPAAGTAEVHEMKMEGEVMRMRPVAKVDLPAGTAVDFKPGGYHLMLMDLKQPLKTGAVVPLTLIFRDAQGAERKQDLSVPVATQAPAAPKH